MTDLLVTHALRSGGAPTALLALDGRIAALGEDALGAAPPEAERYNAGGRLLLPGLVEGHIHLDKTLIGLPFIPHIPGGSIAARIAAEKALRRSVPLSVEERGGKLIQRISAFGTVAARSHVDIDTEVGLKGLEALLTLKARYAHLIDLQIVAFPQSGILADRGVAELLHEAVKNGADLVGGLDPSGIDADPKGHLDAVFAVAERHGVGVDIHLHDGGRLGSWELRLIAERAAALGLDGRVAVSHAFCLGELDDHDFAATAGALASVGRAGVLGERQCPRRVVAVWNGRPDRAFRYRQRPPGLSRRRGYRARLRFGYRGERGGDRFGLRPARGRRLRRFPAHGSRLDRRGGRRPAGGAHRVQARGPGRRLIRKKG